MVIAGGTGFLGKALEKYFSAIGFEIIILTRNPKKKNQMKWDGESHGPWVDVLERSDVLINLAGKSVDCRYNEKNKAEIISSRVESTSILRKVMAELECPPKLWVNSSSGTIYIHAQTMNMTEQHGIIGDDFSMNVCKSWESEFFNPSPERIRKIALRTAIVLGTEGGAFPKLKRISSLGLGGKTGRGNQFMSWIHITDYCRMIEFMITHEGIAGSINMSSPDIRDNNSFMKALAKLTKPWFQIPTPVALLEIGAILIKTESELLLKSRRVYPESLLQHGFKFQFENLDHALEDLFAARHKSPN